MKRKTIADRLPAEETWHPYEQLKLETVLQDVGERPTPAQLSLDPFTVFAVLPSIRPRCSPPSDLDRLAASLRSQAKLWRSPEDLYGILQDCTKHEPGPWTAALARVKPELVIGKTIYCRRCSEQYKYSGPG